VVPTSDNFRIIEIKIGVVMRAKKQINTTLGELIAAVTDEVLPVAGNRDNANALVSYILTDLFATRRVKLRRRSVVRTG
jgi:hypothetical protein